MSFPLSYETHRAYLERETGCEAPLFMLRFMPGGVEGQHHSSVAACATDAIRGWLPHGGREMCAICGEQIDRKRNAVSGCAESCCACHRLMPSDGAL